LLKKIAGAKLHAVASSLILATTMAMVDEWC
jgi:hypothetical protein